MATTLHAHRRMAPRCLCLGASHIVTPASECSTECKKGWGEELSRRGYHAACASEDGTKVFVCGGIAHRDSCK